MDDGKFHKVANVIGESMKLHPHGDASIGDALVVLANKEYFIEKQGTLARLLPVIVLQHPVISSVASPHWLRIRCLISDSPNGKNPTMVAATSQSPCR